MSIRTTFTAAVAAAAVACALATATPTAAGAASVDDLRASSPTRAAQDLSPRHLTGRDRTTLRRYERDTWRSMTAMTDRRTGLPSDNIEGDLAASTRSGYTSPTNIGAYLWSTVVARDTRLITRREAARRLTTTLWTLARMQRHGPSGMYYNWYSPRTGAKLTTWPVDGSPVKPFLSSVDNAWLATALLLVGHAEPRLRRLTEHLRRSMDFGFYYDPAENQIRGGFWDEDPHDPAAVLDNYRHRGPDVWYTGHHYGAFNTEPRMASYLGIAAGQIPRKHYFGTFRTFPDTCDWSWTEQQATGTWRTYLGVRVFEGAYDYRGMKLVPTWGGSMFEALMVPLFVPEERWGPRSWGITHPLYVQAQIEHGLTEARYGYWGFSPSSDPTVPDGYREYGVDPIGMNPDGYSSDVQRTTVDAGYGSCRPAQPPPSSYGDGVVTPHASFLALRYAPRESLRNLSALRHDFDAYGRGGFYDAVDVGTAAVAKRYLSLDQGMVMAALGNALTHDSVRSYVARGELRQVVRPLMAMERFTASPRP